MSLGDKQPSVITHLSDENQAQPGADYIHIRHMRFYANAFLLATLLAPYTEGAAHPILYPVGLLMQCCSYSHAGKVKGTTLTG